MVEGSDDIAEESGRENPLRRLSAPSCKLFSRYHPGRVGLIHHLFGKDKLIKPIVVGLEQAYSPHLVDEDVPKNLSSNTVRPFPQRSKGTPDWAASVSFAACKVERCLSKEAAL